MDHEEAARLLLAELRGIEKNGSFRAPSGDMRAARELSVEALRGLPKLRAAHDKLQGEALRMRADYDELLAEREEAAKLSETRVAGLCACIRDLRAALAGLRYGAPEHALKQIDAALAVTRAADAAGIEGHFVEQMAEAHDAAVGSETAAEKEQRQRAILTGAFADLGFIVDKRS